MNRSYRILPIYTADVSGVCSALFELGGMVVMHDPSGCNSTYNTHDELRWYDHDSLIFISGLTELDAILGNDEKFIEDILSAAEELSPKFIALASAPIPYMNGTDFDGIARIIEEKSGIPTFFVLTNGMHDYVQGAGNALAELAKRFVDAPAQKRPRSVNLLGVTPLDFGTQETVDAMKRRFTDHNWEVVSCWAMGDTLEDIRRAGEASINVVVSAVGLSAAKILKKRFGTPYMIGIPVDNYEKDFFSMDSTPVASTTKDMPIVTLIGEPVTMGSLGKAISKKYGISYRVLCPLEGCEELLRPEDILVHGEEEIERELKTSTIVVADPLYRPVCGENVTFYELPHVAFSGRCFQKDFINLFDIKL